MAVDRPTFSETWHRVADLRPRLRPDVQAHRRVQRDTTWHVLREPLSDRFFRCDDGGYRFLSLLDGRRTVDEAWELCRQRLDDSAPTQNEAIALLGDLHGANLLTSDLPPDTSVLFKRSERRRQNDRRQRLNPLSIRIPLCDPDAFLMRWLPLASWCFHPVGFAIWCALIVAAGVAVLSHADGLSDGWRNAVAAHNVLWLYLTFTLLKLLHELGHGFACRHFAQVEGTGGGVHTLGVMLLIFNPSPYVDSSSAWALRNRWRRAAVGAAGMYVELAAAAVAALVWSATDAGLVHGLAYNAMLVASVSTLVFNANPLLRFDGYFILSDALDVPNLMRRSQELTHHLAKRYLFGVVATTRDAGEGEPRTLLVAYALAAAAYRLLVAVGIIWFLADRFFFVGVLLALAVLVTSLVLPLGRFVQYLCTSPELRRNRPRALAISGAMAATALVLLGVVPAPDSVRAQGIVEPAAFTRIYADADGWLTQRLASGTPVTQGAALISAESAELASELEQCLAERDMLLATYRMTRQEEVATAQAVAQQVASAEERAAELRTQLERLRLRAPGSGIWVADSVTVSSGQFIGRGDYVGSVAEPGAMLFRVAADQWAGPRIVQGDVASMKVEARLASDAATCITGSVVSVRPAGNRRLLSAALGDAAGGHLRVAADSPDKDVAAEAFFELEVAPDSGDQQIPFLIGQRVTVRFDLPRRPLLAQAWRALRQTIQGRYGV